MVDVSHLASQLYNTSLVDASPLYAALAQGTPIGSFAFDESMRYQWVEIAFNSAGLSALNSKIANGASAFAVGGTLPGGPSAPAPLAGGGMLAALAAALALLVTRGSGFARNLPGFRKLGMV